MTNKPASLPASAPACEINLYPVMSPDSYGRKVIAMAYDFNEMAKTHVLHSVLASIADRIAEKWVEEHYQEIAAAIDPQAVANLVVADAAKEVRDSLARTPSERVREVVRREVYERGIFGGVKRIL